MEINLRECMYREYITEHISNVRIVYLKYGDKLCKILNINPYILVDNINKHDHSKYSEEEFEGYRQYFHPCSDEIPDEKIFELAWKHHYKNNPHHPEYWVDEINNTYKDMEPIYIAEMLLDWEAMSMKFGGNTYEYYMKEKDNKPFSDGTKKIIEKAIDIFK